MAIKDWSTTAASNNSAPPDGFPENMAPSAVNDAARETMAQVRTWYEDAEWINRGYTYAYVGATQFKVAGTDVSSIYHVGRRVRAVGSSTGTRYGTITASSFSTDTTVTVAFDSGSLANEPLQISHGATGASNTSVPGATISEDDWTIQGALTATGAFTASGTLTATGALTASDDLTVSKTFTMKVGSDEASANALSPSDGNFFDVTGTTAITSIDTMGVGTLLVLHFDGALTLTHDGTALVLPTAANITTAAGDIAQFYEYSSGNWRCISYSKADGTTVASTSGNALEYVETVTVGASDADVQFTDLESGHDHIFVLDNIGPATDNVFPQLRTSPDTGGSPTFDSGAGDYQYYYQVTHSGDVPDYSETYMRYCANIGSADGEELAGVIEFINPVAATFTRFNGLVVAADTATQIRQTQSAGYRALAEACNAVQFFFSSGNMKASTGTIRHYKRATS